MKLVSIGELSKLLDLIDNKSKKPLNHTLRYWEKEFKQIKPKIIRNRRYYSKDQIEVVKMIKFLLKDKGMSISGVKKILNSNINKLDDYNSDSLKAEYYKKEIKEKSKNILEKIKIIKNMAKKTHLKVRMVPESNPDSKFIYYAKTTKGEKAKDKLKLKKYNLNTRKHEFFFVEKKCHLTVSNYFLKFLNS